jgi:hypothetical protein
MLTCIVLTVVTFASIFLNILRTRIIEDTPTSKVRSAAQGYVELIGTAKQMEDDNTTAALTGLPCLWYSYEVEKYYESAKRKGWRTVEKGASNWTISLSDETGICHLDPDKAHITASITDQWMGTTSRPKKITGADQPLSVTSSGQYRYTENRIINGDPLFAIGLFQTVHAPSIASQANSIMNGLLGDWKRNQETLIQRFDADGDGTIDFNEWETARKTAATEADQQLENATDDGSPVHLMACPPSSRYPYLIATKPQHHLVTQFRRMSATHTTAFMVSVCTTIYLINGYF